MGLRCLGALAGSVEGVGSAPAQRLHLGSQSPQPPALMGTAAWALGSLWWVLSPHGDLLPAAGSASVRACWPHTTTSPRASPRGPAWARGSTCLTIRTPDSVPRPPRRQCLSVCSSQALPAPALQPPCQSPCWHSPPWPRPASRCTAPACWRRASPPVSRPQGGLQGALSAERQWELESPALSKGRVLPPPGPAGELGAAGQPPSTMGPWGLGWPRVQLLRPPALPAVLLGTDTPGLSSSQQSPLSVVMSLGMALLIFIIIGAFQKHFGPKLLSLSLISESLIKPTGRLKKVLNERVCNGA